MKLNKISNKGKNVVLSRRKCRQCVLWENLIQLNLIFVFFLVTRFSSFTVSFFYPRYCVYSCLRTSDSVRPSQDRRGHYPRVMGTVVVETDLYSKRRRYLSLYGEM